MNNIPKAKIGIVAVSRDCFPESLSVNRRKALVDAYKAKYDAADIYECPICIVESEIHMVQALEDIKKAVKENDAEAVYIRKPSEERQKANFNNLLKNAKVLPRKKVEA